MKGQWWVTIVTATEGDFLFIVAASGRDEAETKGREFFRRGKHAPGVKIKRIEAKLEGKAE